MAYRLNPFTGEFDYTIGPGTGTASIEFDTDAGAANPNGSGVIEILGGTGISTSGVLNMVQISLDTPVSVANGGTGNNTFAQYGIIYGDGTNPLPNVAPLDDGQLIIGSTGAAPTGANLTAGDNITITNGAGSITISSSITFPWTDVTGTSDDLVGSNGYIADNAALVTLTLPASVNQGEIIRVAGYGSGGWRIAQNAGQTIHFGNMDTTTGVGGRLDSTNRYDSIEMLCVVDDLDFVILSSVGNITVV